MSLETEYILDKYGEWNCNRNHKIKWTKQLIWEGIDMRENKQKTKKKKKHKIPLKILHSQKNRIHFLSFIL